MPTGLPAIATLEPAVRRKARRLVGFRDREPVFPGASELAGMGEGRPRRERPIGYTILRRATFLYVDHNPENSIQRQRVQGRWFSPGAAIEDRGRILRVP
jgi:hypothetical protein